MSKYAYGLSRLAKAIEEDREIRKSFVGGKWVPITKLPKDRLKQAVQEGRFGQKHLQEIGEAKRGIHHANLGQIDTLHSHKQDVGSVGRHKLSTGLEELGPHVVRPLKPGDKARVTLLDRNTKKVIRAQNAPDKSRRALGLKFHTNKPFVNAHELAHANSSRRSVVTRTAALQNNVFEQNPGIVSRAVKEKTVGPASLRLSEKNVGAQQRYMMGEEARADVVATRKLKSNKPLFSGHIADTGRPKDYLEARNRVERGMRIKPTEESEMYWKKKPVPLAQREPMTARPATLKEAQRIQRGMSEKKAGRLKQWSARLRGERHVRTGEPG